MEENQNETWGGLKKTIIGLITTIVTAAGAYVTSKLFGGDDGGDVTMEQTIPAPAPVIINLENNNTQQQVNSGGTTIIKETIIERDRPTGVTKEEPKLSESPW
jgi:flagellar basal body-associated protein FliL